MYVHSRETGSDVGEVQVPQGVGALGFGSGGVLPFSAKLTYSPGTSHFLTVAPRILRFSHSLLNVTLRALDSLVKPPGVFCPFLLTP